MNLQSKLYNLLCDFRAFEYKVNSPKFKEKFNGLSSEDQQKINTLIDEALTWDSTTRIRIMLEIDRVLDQNRNDVRYLRDKASRYSIPNYSRMDKSELIREIKKHEQRSRETAAIIPTSERDLVENSFLPNVGVGA